MSRTSKREPVKKSPSKRLRGVLFHLWKIDKEGNRDFDEYYERKMEKLINHYKKLIYK